MFAMLSYASCSALDFAFSMNSKGVLNKNSVTYNNVGTIVINRLVVNDYGVSCDLKFQSSTTMNAEDIVVYRLDGYGKHDTSREGDPLWEVNIGAQVNPRWCSYEVVDDKTLRFVDTFSKDLILKDNPQANTLKYVFKDKTHHTEFHVLISNVFYYHIVTAINETNVYEEGEVKYINAQGIVSDSPFNGFNIVVKNGRVTKKIF